MYYIIYYVLRKNYLFSFNVCVSNFSNTAQIIRNSIVFWKIVFWKKSYFHDVYR